MKFIVDTHTHSISSGHAYSTITEMAKGAADNGIKMFAVTDHGPAMPGTTHIYHFGNLKVVPAELNGVRIIKGAESNIIDYNGSIDIPEDYAVKLEFIIASFHEICIEPGTVEENTRAMTGALKNPFVDAAGHAGNPQFPVDIEKVVLAAKEYGKAIEINNSSFTVRTGSGKNCEQFALKCKEHRVPVVCGSDAHISFDIGRFDYVMCLLEEVGMPEELILSASTEAFENFLLKKKENLRKLGY